MRPIAQLLQNGEKQADNRYDCDDNQTCRAKFENISFWKTEPTILEPVWGYVNGQVCAITLKWYATFGSGKCKYWLATLTNLFFFPVFPMGAHVILDFSYAPPGLARVDRLDSTWD